MSQWKSVSTDMSDANRSTDDRSDVVRPSVSMKKRHLGLLEEMANEAYSGNRSACLRAAIEDHARTLEGKDELAVKKLESIVQNLANQITEVKQSLEQDSSEDQSPDDIEGTSQQRSTKSGNPHQIYEIISTYESVSLEDITSQTDAPLVDVADTLQALCERGLIIKSSGTGDVEYEINDSGVDSDE